jgi:hypothetical protein
MIRHVFFNSAKSLEYQTYRKKYPETRRRNEVLSVGNTWREDEKWYESTTEQPMER